ncbi:MAG: HAD family hydrolase [Rhodospirillaceae bacterium]
MTSASPVLPCAALFDWDNTLVDTWPVIHDAMNVTLGAMGHPTWSIDETRERVRLALREAFPALFGERWQEARDIYYARFREIHLDRLTVMPGAEALLERMEARGIHLGVVSNKTGVHLRREARHLGWDRYFARMVGATDAKRDKPAVEPVALALEGSGVEFGPDVWFIGDTEVDLECASNAGCIKVLVRKTPPSDGEFSKFPPDLYFPDCLELETLVSRL